MTSIVALFRGDRLKTADLVAVSADLEITSWVAEQLLTKARSAPPEHPEDPVLKGLHSGRARALELMSEGI